MPTTLITGANRGIGFNLARLYAADGWKVIGTARAPDQADDLANLPGDVSIEALEVTDEHAITALTWLRSCLTQFKSRRSNLDWCDCCNVFALAALR